MKKQYNANCGMRRSSTAKISIPKTNMDPEFLAQLAYVHKEFGQEGTKKFLRESEKINNLPAGSLDSLLELL